MTTLDGHSEGQDECNPDDRATSPPYPCESEVKQTDSRAAKEGKQSGVQQLDNETKNSIADEDDDGGCVLHDLLKDYTSDSADLLMMAISESPSVFYLRSRPPLPKRFLPQ